LSKAMASIRNFNKPVVHSSALITTLALPSLRPPPSSLAHPRRLFLIAVQRLDNAHSEPTRRNNMRHCSNLSLRASTNLPRTLTSIATTFLQDHNYAQPSPCSRPLLARATPLKPSPLVRL
jgi:hypothetical protein